MIKTVFCGTPEFAVPSLQALHKDPRFDIQLVISQPDRPSGRGKKITSSPVKEKALSLGYKVLTPEKAKEEFFLDELESLSADLCVVVAYGQILNQRFLSLFPQRCVNIHSSLLPRWRGAAPMQRAIMAGDSESGVSLQVVVAKLDAGAVIAERKIEIDDSMNAVQLHDQLKVLGSELLTKELTSYLDGNVKPTEQDELRVTHAAKIAKNECPINWSNSAKELHNKIRGLAMGPYASSVYKSKPLKFHITKVVENSGGIAAGLVQLVGVDSFTIACGDEALEVFELQPASKPRMSAGDFIRGYQLKVGDQFGE